MLVIILIFDLSNCFIVYFLVLLFVEIFYINLSKFIALRIFDNNISIPDNSEINASNLSLSAILRIFARIISFFVLLYRDFPQIFRVRKILLSYNLYAPTVLLPPPYQSKISPPFYYTLVSLIFPAVLYQ